MKITIITPCLNAAATIERTMQSIQGQNWPDLEYIICDGGSKDGTLEIIARYPELVTTVISEKDKNVADALNKGFARATGDIFCYLNADDCLTPAAFQAVADLFEKHPDVDVVTGGCLRVFADGSQVTTQVADRYLDVVALRNDFEQPSTFWRAAAHRKAGEFDDSYGLAFDWEWWNRLKSVGCRFLRVDAILSIYYFSETNLTSQGGMRVINEMFRVTRRYGPFFGLSAYVYKFLFERFDMKGFYDVPFEDLPEQKRRVFGRALRILTRIFGERVVYNYNWNWASKQVRNVKWY